MIERFCVWKAKGIVSNIVNIDEDNPMINEFIAEQQKEVDYEVEFSLFNFNIPFNAEDVEKMFEDRVNQFQPANSLELISFKEIFYFFINQSKLFFLFLFI